MKSIHVLTAILLNLVILIMILTSDNPIILVGVFVLVISLFILSKNMSKFKNSLGYFIPLAAITILINMIIVHQGSIVMFTLFNRVFTVEAFIYALALAFKLLLVISLFILLGILIDSDNAVSFFSGVMPKSTLTMMISIKMFPSLRKRLITLTEIYSLRGVDFNSKGAKNKIKNMIPLISVLLEDSLEGAFDIGEASYVRGFLSGNRSIYDRRSLSHRDYIILGSSILMLIIYVLTKLFAMDEFSAYTKLSVHTAMNPGIFINFFGIILFTTELLWLLKEKKDVLY